MIDDLNVLLVLLIISVITISLRLIPFIILNVLTNNKYINFIKEKMPTGIMILLMIYSCNTQQITTYLYWIPRLMGLSLTALIYWKTHNALLSIGLGLFSFMYIMNIYVPNHFLH